MIGYLTGICIHNSFNGSDITLLTESGVGYRVFCSQTAGYVQGSSYQLYVSTIVREQALDLFGFSSAEERELFEILIDVSGVGPRTALGMLSSGTPSSLCSAIAEHNIAFLTSLSGIGKKTAERICIELETKVKKLSFQLPEQSLETQLVEALISMGYTPRDITVTLSAGAITGETLSDRIRVALQLLHK